MANRNRRKPKRIPDIDEIILNSPGPWIRIYEHEFREIMSDVEKVLETDRKRTLQARYKIGRIIKDGIAEISELHREEERQRFFCTLEKALRVGKRWLADSIDLYEHFTPAKLRHVVSLPGVSWGHVREVMYMVNEERDALLEQVASEKLSVRDFRALLRQKYGPRRQPGGGRRAAVPTSPQKGLEDVNRNLTNLLRRSRDIWSGTDKGRYCIAWELSHLPPDFVDEGLQQQVSDAIALCGQGIEELGRLVDGLTRSSHRIAQCLEVDAGRAVARAAEEDADAA